MAWLAASERVALEHICATLTGTDPEAPRIVAIAAGVADAIEHAGRAAERNDFRRALHALDHPLANAALAGVPKRLAQMSQTERERVLRVWCNSRLGLLRKGFQTFKRLVLFHEYALPDGLAVGNPNWPQIGYPGPPFSGTASTEGDPAGRAGAPADAAAAADPRLSASLQSLRIAKDSRLSADVVVVGSGAGGSVVAAELAAAGAQVIVLEKGGFRDHASFDGIEYSAMRDLFEKRGILTSDDVGVVVLAGSTLGGGTTINWTTSLPTPGYVLDEWERELGVTGAAGPEWQASLRAVSERTLVNTASSENRQNALLRQGGEALGYRWIKLPRNVHACRDCGFCGFGCRGGSKQSALATYLPDAQRHGAQIVTDCRVERVTTSGGRASGVLARVNGHSLRIDSPMVVVAAGSIHSPALLLRSGLANPHIGRHLHLHPVPAAYGVFERPVEAWSGTMQCVAVDEFMQLDGGYGFAVEVPPAHPGLLALGVQWQDAHSHRKAMLQAAHLAVFFALVRDRDGGRVAVDREGRPVIRYRLSDFDSRHVVRGAVEIVRLLAAAGAHTVGGPSNGLPEWRSTGGPPLSQHLDRIHDYGYRVNDMTLFSAHQMSSCRMAGSAELGVVDPEGESFEVEGLFVADGSALPSATGVNPMISIMALAHHVAQQMKTRLP